MNDPAFASAQVIDEAFLRRHPLPEPDEKGDKETRGKVVVIAGSREMPGAAVLSGTAALRAGAGKLVVVTCAGVAGLVGTALPEARVVGVGETRKGGFLREEFATIESLVHDAEAILIGPGMMDQAGAADLVAHLLPYMNTTRVVLDAAAMEVVCRPGFSMEEDAPNADVLKGTGFRQNVLLTPHAGEMAHLTGVDKTDILRSPGLHAREFSCKWNAVLALKGSTTYLTTPSGETFRHDGGNVGLAVSGSGDVLAGIIAGLLARGTSLEHAAAWGIALHAHAGERLAGRVGPLGFLAREIPAEIPGLMNAFRRSASFA